MGNLYTNYTLRGPTQDSVASALTGRSAFVSPQARDCVVVFDEQSEAQDQSVIESLAANLSGKFDCPVLAVLNHLMGVHFPSLGLGFDEVLRDS